LTGASEQGKQEAWYRKSRRPKAYGDYLEKEDGRRLRDLSLPASTAKLVWSGVYWYGDACRVNSSA
jgi:hypothetical protein